MIRNACNIESLFAGVAHEALHCEDGPYEVNALEFSSRDVKPGALFFCVPGTVVDGHDFAADALTHGAVGLVVERELELDAPQFLVEDARAALALCSANFYDSPSRKLDVVGITGTNGKTTTCFLVEHLLRHAGMRAGLIGTVECHVADEVYPSAHTTPESRDFQELLARMVDAHVDACACEVSSHALDLGRVRGTHFSVAAFSNLTQDHLDYHKTMEEYFAAKARLFTEYEPDACVICTDSDAGKRMAQLCSDAGHVLYRVGSDADCEVRLVEARFDARETRIDVEAAGEWLHLTLPLVGRFNVENALIAFGIGMALGLTNEVIVSGLESAPQVPGRLERVTGAKGTHAPFGVLVDYAHTPDSVAKAIDAVRAVTQGRIFCVFGCGGDRDHGKRPKMGAAALAADFAIVTSDNPRTEDPDAIIEQIVAGMQDCEERYTVIPDRAEAIRFAIEQAREGDVVLIAGKGHEDYQIIGDVKHHFDDREVAAAAIEELES